MLFEPGETRPEGGPAPAPDRDFVGQVGGGVFGASSTAASTGRRMARSGWTSLAISRTSARNSASVPAGREPEVSMMTAMVSMPSERIDGKYNPLSMKRRLGRLQE